MSQVPNKYLFSMKSLLVMCLLLALFGALNTIERSRYEGVYYRGFPLAYRETMTVRLTGKLSSFDSDDDLTAVVQEFGAYPRGGSEYTLTFSETEEGALSSAAMSTFNTLNLILNMAMGIGLSALLAFACEREVFRKFRAARSVEWRPTGSR